jgi:hypothetical protein
VRHRRLDNPLIDNRALFWLVGAFGFDGLLHWGLNQWGGDSALTPIQNSSNGLIAPAHWNMATSEGSWMQGDGKLLYCGESEPVPSSRLINIRDGMEDYGEKNGLCEPSICAKTIIFTKTGSGPTLGKLQKRPFFLRLPAAGIGCGRGGCAGGAWPRV